MTTATTHQTLPAPRKQRLTMLDPSVVLPDLATIPDEAQPAAAKVREVWAAYEQETHACALAEQEANEAPDLDAAADRRALDGSRVTTGAATSPCRRGWLSS